MKTTIVVCALLCTLVTVICGVAALAGPSQDPTAELLALEQSAMEGWLHGNPDANLALLDPSVTYFHVPLEARLDGLPAVKAFFEPYRGRPLFDSYEIVAPKTQVWGDLAVFTYTLVTHNGTVVNRWNSTEVYVRQRENWRVIHAHWSKAGRP